MVQVFVLQHIHIRDDGNEDVKFIGVYSSSEEADRAIARLRRLPGFSNTPDGFHVDEYRINQDHWVDGYVAVESA